MVIIVNYDSKEDSDVLQNDIVEGEVSNKADSTKLAPGLSSENIEKGSDCREFEEDVVGQWKYLEADSILELRDNNTFVFRDYPTLGKDSGGTWGIEEKGFKLTFDQLDEFWNEQLKLDHERFDWGVKDYSYERKYIIFDVRFWLGSTEGLSKKEACKNGKYYINIFNTLYYKVSDETD
jgi:hypothetical protein